LSLTIGDSMPDLGIQFLAIPEEAANFFRQCVEEYQLHVVKITFPPYRVEEFPLESFADVFSDSSNAGSIAFTIERPVIPKGTKDLRDENPDALSLNLGKRSPKGIKESFLSARTANKEAIAVWNRIGKKLKAITSRGAIATNPDTGISGPAKWYRFTEGARKFEASGGTLLSSTGHVLKPVPSST
jgi:hypothetical protein